MDADFYNERNRRIVKIVDPSLEFVKSFDGYANSVFKVETDGKFFVLKFGLLNSPEYRCIKRELKALELTQDMKGVVNLIENYGSRNIGDEDFDIILKEYVVGNNQDENEMIKESILEKQIRETVEELHERQLINLDLFRRNIIVSPKRDKATLFDFDICVYIPDEKAISYRFGELYSNDLRMLENLFK